MTDLLAIGTRKGLWLARSDDDRRTWTVDGPAPAGAGGRRGLDRHPRLGARGCSPASSTATGGPTVMWSDDLGATWNESDHGAIRFPEDTGAALARVWQLRPDTADRPGVVWAGCEPHSLWRSTDGGCSLRTGPRACTTTRTGPTWQPGGGGGAVHTVLPDPASDRVTVAMSTGGVYVSEDGGAEVGAAQPGHHRDLRARPAARVRAVRAQGRRRRRRSRPAVRAEPLRRLPQRRRRGLVDVDRRRAARRLRLPDRRLADHPRHGLGGAAGRRHAAGAAGRPAARPPHPRRRGDLDRAGRRACPTAPGWRSCATRSAPTRPTPPASTWAPATAASTPAPTRATRFTAGRRPPARRPHGASAAQLP